MSKKPVGNAKKKKNRWWKVGPEYPGEGAVKAVTAGSISCEGVSDNAH